MLKIIVGFVLILLAIFLGLYVGVWLCLIGGLLDIVNFALDLTKGQPVTAMSLVWGVVKFLFAGIFGWLTFYVFFFPGIGFLIGGKPTKTTYTKTINFRKR